MCLGELPLRQPMSTDSASGDGLVRVLEAQDRAVSSFDRDAVRRVEDLTEFAHGIDLVTGDLNAVIQDAEWSGADTLNGHSLVVHDGVADPINEAGIDSGCGG